MARRKDFCSLLAFAVCKPLFVVPFDRDSSFVGRKDVLADIEKTNELTTEPRHTRTALVGLGGVG
jgi:hypothetical protein